jgi:hypothetical protein
MGLPPAAVEVLCWLGLLWWALVLGALDAIIRAKRVRR